MSTKCEIRPVDQIHKLHSFDASNGSWIGNISDPELTSKYQNYKGLDYESFWVRTLGFCRCLCFIIILFMREMLFRVFDYRCKICIFYDFSSFNVVLFSYIMRYFCNKFYSNWPVNYLSKYSKVFEFLFVNLSLSI